MGQEGDKKKSIFIIESVCRAKIEGGVASSTLSNNKPK